MTKAIELAKECDAIEDAWPFPGDSHKYTFRAEQLETFYARAQAQTLRVWAKEAEGYTNPLKLANDMDAAAAELESKK